MPLRASDIVPISEARARLTELAEDVVGSGSEKVLTKNGASYVALIDARRLDYYHALELSMPIWCRLKTPSPVCGKPWRGRSCLTRNWTRHSASHRRREHSCQRKGSGGSELSGVPACRSQLHGGAGRRFRIGAL